LNDFAISFETTQNKGLNERSQFATKLHPHISQSASQTGAEKIGVALNTLD